MSAVDAEEGRGCFGFGGIKQQLLCISDDTKLPNNNQPLITKQSTIVDVFFNVRQGK